MSASCKHSSTSTEGALTAQLRSDLVVSFVVKRWRDKEIALSCLTKSYFNSGFLVAGGTGIEPATCGFGERGAPSRCVSCSLFFAQRRHSTSVSVSCNLTAPVGAAVSKAVKAGHSGSGGTLAC